MRDTEIAMRYIFIGMARTVIQRDIRTIQAGPFKIKEPYIELLEKMHSAATNERRKLKKIMWDRKISVIPLGKEESTSSYQLYYNGREKLETYHNNIIRKNVKEILLELIATSQQREVWQTNSRE